MNEQNLGRCLLVFLGGAVAGAAAGILLAPHKGSVTRKKIVRKGQFAADVVKDKIDDLKESIEDLAEEIEEVAEHKAKRLLRH